LKKKTKKNKKQQQQKQQQQKTAHTNNVNVECYLENLGQYRSTQNHNISI